MQRWAIISDDEKYRYILTRMWDLRRPRVCFVMLNPSTADGYEDDPTIRKCIGFAKTWDYGSLSVVNLYASRCTDPKLMWKQNPFPVGKDNDHYIEQSVAEAQTVVAAWGSSIRDRVRVHQVVRLVKNAMCLGITQKGMPRHPLYVSYATPLSPYLRDGAFTG